MICLPDGLGVADISKPPKRRHMVRQLIRTDDQVGRIWSHVGGPRRYISYFAGLNAPHTVAIGTRCRVRRKIGSASLRKAIFTLRADNRGDAVANSILLWSIGI